MTAGAALGRRAARGCWTGAGHGALIELGGAAAQGAEGIDPEVGWWGDGGPFQLERTGVGGDDATGTCAGAYTGACGNGGWEVSAGACARACACAA
jgi:hypothetical protein